MLMWERTITGLYSVVSPFYLFSSFDENTTISFFFFSPHQSPDTMLSPLISPRSRPLPDVAGGLKLLGERPSVEPCYHVQDEEVPILEPPVQHRLAILRQIILMEGSEALKIPAEEYDCLPCQETCLGGVSAPEKPTEDEIVDTYPYRPLPRRGVAARLRVVHLLERGEGAHTGWTAEEGGIQILPRDNLLCLLWCGYACPQGHEPAPQAETLYETVILTGLPPRHAGRGRRGEALSTPLIGGEGCPLSA